MMWELFDALFFLVLGVIGCALFALLVYGIAVGLGTFCELCVRTFDRITR